MFYPIISVLDTVGEEYSTSFQWLKNNYWKLGKIRLNSGKKKGVQKCMDRTKIKDKKYWKEEKDKKVRDREREI